MQVAQRCTYCGPDDAWGKVYCEGKPCFDYFWSDDNPDTATKWRDCSAATEPFTGFRVSLIDKHSYSGAHGAVH